MPMKDEDDGRTDRLVAEIMPIVLGNFNAGSTSERSIEALGALSVAAAMVIHNFCYPAQHDKARKLVDDLLMESLQALASHPSVLEGLDRQPKHHQGR